MCRMRPYTAVIRVYDAAGNVIENARARGRFQRIGKCYAHETKSRYAVTRDG